MKRGGPLKRRTRLRPRSEKRERYEAELDEKRMVLRQRSGNRCEAKLVGCRGIPWEPHHLVRRSQGGTNNETNLMAVCTSCHMHVHLNPQWAYENGYLLRRPAPSQVTS